MEDKLYDRMLPDYETVCSDIEDILSRVRVLETNSLFAKSLGPQALQKIKSFDTAIKKRLQDSFSIVIAGEFKRGKSTLINALLGEKVAPTAVTPETVTINRISYAEKPKAEAVLKNGRKLLIEKSELRREALEPLKDKLPAPIDYIELRENIDILKDITIVDTPGIGDLLKRFDRQVADYLINADALIFVISARSPLSLTEQSFISSSILPQRFSRIFIVANMADILETRENIEKIKALTEDRAKMISPDISAYIVSALDEFCRKKALDRPEPDLCGYLEDNFMAFENALKDDIILQKDVIKSTRGIELTRLMLDDISSKIQLIKSSMKLNIDKLTAAEDSYRDQNSDLMQSIERHKDSLAEEIERMKEETKGWISDFMARLEQEIRQMQSSASISDLDRHFQFYMMDMTKKALLCCLDCHNVEIADLISDASKSFAGDISTQAFKCIDSQISDCIADISWTNVDSAMFVANDVLNLSSYIGPLFMIGQAVAGFVRQKIVSKRQREYLSPILEGYEEVVSGIRNRVDEIYNEIKRDSVGKLSELYQCQIDASMEAIRQAREITESADVKKEELFNYFDEVLGSIDEMKAVLKKYNE